MAYCCKRLRVHPWSKQRKILKALAEPGARVSVRSCNGAGKTFVAAAAVHWFLRNFNPCRVITTATTLHQLRNQLWVEIRKLHARAGFREECQTLALRLSDEQFAIGQTARDATGFHGHHAPHILVIADEAAGISEEIWEGIDALLTSEDARLLMIGNPTSTSGRFYDSHHSKRDMYATLAIACTDTPNFTEEGESVLEDARRALVTKEWATRQASEWGQDSPAYRARIMGEFPDQAEGSLIALSWIDAARTEEPAADPAAPVELGADIARHGSCENAVYVRQGPRVLGCAFWRSDDLMETTGRIVAIGKQHRAAVYRIDATGMGAGVADRLREVLGSAARVEAVFVGDRPRDPERFVMLRDEIWWVLRERFREGNIGPLPDERTQAQCSTVRQGYDSRGRIRVESKDDMQKRSLPSPDRADALALAFMPTKPVVKADVFIA